MRIKRIVALLCVALMAFSCQEKEPATVPVTSVSVAPSTLDMLIGESKALSATVSPSNATSPSVSWTSSNPSVATVSKDGSVSALAEGTVTITATADGKKGTCTVNVSKPFVDVQSVTLNKLTLSLVEEQSETLIATVKPDDATEPSVTWTSSNKSVADVDQNGTVLAVKAGTATITASAGSKSAFSEVTVVAKYIDVQSVTLSSTEISMNKGDTRTLTAMVKPDDATDKTVSWSSSNTSVATVENGVVRAVGGGNAVITAEAGGQKATCSVTVIVPVESISLSEENISLEKGITHKLTVLFNPEDATDKTVLWTSSDDAVATIQQDGTITAVKEGTAVIIAVSNNKTATCKVTVVIPVEGITLSKNTLSLNKGESFTLTATVSPDNATDKSVKWESSNSSIVSVENGVVRAHSAGTATVTARAGDKSAQCVVTVSVPLESIVLSHTSLSMYVGQQTSLTYEVYPADATGVTIVWTSSDTSIVNVNNGQLTASREGTAVITAKSGTISATCTVLVDRIGNGGHEGVGYEDWN